MQEGCRSFRGRFAGIANRPLKGGEKMVSWGAAVATQPPRPQTPKKGKRAKRSKIQAHFLELFQL